MTTKSLSLDELRDRFASEGFICEIDGRHLVYRYRSLTVQVWTDGPHPSTPYALRCDDSICAEYFGDLTYDQLVRMFTAILPLYIMFN